jgi:hypothetical protein
VLRLFKRKLIADTMFLLIGLAFTVQIFMTGISIASRGSFSGIVYAASGVPVLGAIVRASGSSGQGVAVTDSSGAYNINTGLQAGTYNVTVIALGYLEAETDNVQVTVGHTTTNIDFNLQRSGGISGKVTDSVSMQPVKSIMVMALNSSGGAAYGWANLTDSSGNYLLATNLPTGQYNVSVLFPEDYISQTIGPISVTAGAEVKNQNITLDPSGIISGRVTTTGSAPLANVSIGATSTSPSGYYGSAQTNATGYYRITSGLGSATYVVMASYIPNPLIYAINSSVTVNAGTETPGVDFTLSVSPTPSGIIMGKVTDTNSNPIQNAHVNAAGETMSDHGSADTDAQGNYVISSGLLDTDNYTVSVSAIGYTSANLTHVSVTVSQVTANKNFQLSSIPPAQSGAITGTVQGEANPIPELQYPTVFLLFATLVAAMLARALKTRKPR